MNKIFILTVAGISADSGLSTFRDADGLWEGQKVEDDSATQIAPELIEKLIKQA